MNRRTAPRTGGARTGRQKFIVARTLLAGGAAAERSRLPNIDPCPAASYSGRL
jgi:hypothetical protein